MGDGTSGDAGDPGFDLFDRWLAHREESAAADEPADAEPTDAEPSAEPAPEEPAATPDPDGPIDPLFDESFPTDESEQTPEEPDLELPLDLAPAEPVLAAAEPESPLSTPAAAGPPAGRSREDLSNDVSRSILEALATPTPVPRTPDPNPVTPEAFEAVIIPSARKKFEPRRGLLSGRRKRTGADPLDQPLVGPLVEPDRVPEVAPVVDADAARRAELDRLAAEQAERQTEQLRQAQAADAAARAEADRLAAEETARAAEAARQAELDRLAAEETARQAELDRLAAEQAEREAEQLRQAQATEAAARVQAPRAPEPAPAPETTGRVDQVDAGREVFAAFAAAGAGTDPGTQARTDSGTEAPGTPPPEDEPEPRKHRRLGHRLAAAAASAPSAPAAPAARAPGLSQPDAIRALLAERAAAGETRAEPAPGRAGPEAHRAGRSTPQTASPRGEAPSVGESTNVEFAPRVGTRRLVNVLLLLALGGAAVAAYVAYQDRSEVNIGIAATLGFLTLVIWAVRAGSDTARLSVRSGQLEVVRGGGRFVFDLTSRYTPIEVVGKPGQRGWKVLFLRRSMAPFVVDASMVDPEEFMRVLRRHRPEHD